MIKRFVKMTFKPEFTEKFVGLFNAKKEFIAAVNGCTYLELLKDTSNPNVFFTFSLWENELFIEDYRNSELFKGVWAETKVLFDAAPEAWSLKGL